MNDLQKILDKINYARSQKFISQEEAENLRARARKMADNKGNLKEDEKNKINNILNNALNKKGQEAKKETGLKPPTKKDETKKDERPGRGNQNPRTDSKWDKFDKGFENLKEPQDKEVIRGLFGGRRPGLADFKTLSENKKDALVNAVKDGKISGDEKRSLHKLFKKSGGGGGNGNGGNPPPLDSDGDGVPDNKDKDDDNDGIKDNKDKDDDGDGIPDEEEPAHGGPNPDPEPTVKGGNKKINIPKPENRANYTVPKDSTEPLLMPDIDKKITKEIQRITKQLISTTKEFIEGGINYDGIDFIPDDEILTEDGESFFEINDYNSPGTLNSGMADERMAEISEAINAILDMGRRESKDKYNYAEFLDLFELRYNNSGEAYYRFNIELTGETFEYIEVKLVNNETTTGEDDDTR